MAKKIFCDVCGDEMSHHATQQHFLGAPSEVNVQGQDGGLKFLVTVSVKMYNPGQDVDVCNDCLHDIVGRLDTRPRAG